MPRKCLVNDFYSVPYFLSVVEINAFRFRSNKNLSVWRGFARYEWRCSHWIKGCAIRNLFSLIRIAICHFSSSQPRKMPIIFSLNRKIDWIFDIFSEFFDLFFYFYRRAGGMPILGAISERQWKDEVTDFPRFYMSRRIADYIGMVELTRVYLPILSDFNFSWRFWLNNPSSRWTR